MAWPQTMSEQIWQLSVLFTNSIDIMSEYIFIFLSNDFESRYCNQTLERISGKVCKANSSGEFHAEAIYTVSCASVLRLQTSKFKMPL